MVRNGYLPERNLLTGLGPAPVRIPKIRDRTGSGIKFNSALVPPYVRKAQQMEAALPWLYLRGISTGDMQEALSVLLGAEAQGLSPAVVSRLKAEWAEAHAAWNRRDLSGEQRLRVGGWDLLGPARRRRPPVPAGPDRGQRTRGESAVGVVG